MGRRRKDTSIDVLDDAQVVEEQALDAVNAFVDEVNEADEEVHQPSRTDKGWGEYVMSQFSEDELFDGRPTLDGLRRVTEQLIGWVTQSHVRIAQVPTPENEGRAVAEATIYINILDSNEDFGDNVELVFSDVADVFHGNTDDEFARFPTSVAASRAEARCFRKALGLRKVCSAEEMTNKTLADAGLSGSIVPAQIRTIDNLCRKLNINGAAFVNMGAAKYSNITDVDGTVALKMIQHLNAYQQNKKGIPAAIADGYVDGWFEKSLSS